MVPWGFSSVAQCLGVLLVLKEEVDVSSSDPSEQPQRQLSAKLSRALQRDVSPQQAACKGVL